MLQPTQRFLLLGLVFLLSACESFSPKSVSPKLQDYTDLQTLNKWRAGGKMKVTYAKGNRSASYDWQNFSENFALRLYGPFGLGTTWVRRTSKGVTLERPGANPIYAKTPEALMRRILGTSLPVSTLQQWIKGTPSQKYPVDALNLDERGLVTHLSQLGWELRYTNYQQVDNDNWLLPTKLIATKDDLRILLVVNRWELK